METSNRDGLFEMLVGLIGSALLMYLIDQMAKAYHG